MRMRILLWCVLLWSGLATAGVDDAVAAFSEGDFQTAEKEFHKLAEQGDAFAQFFLGFMYLEGQGVPQDYAQAMEWYRKAAAQGNTLAQVSLGFMYDKGQGVPQNHVLAYQWMNLAAASGDKGAIKNRDLMVVKMTASQLEEAQRLAREWSAERAKEKQ